MAVGQSFTLAPASALVANDDPLKPFVHLNFASLINDRGQIVADGVDSRNGASTSQYLLTPRR